MKMYSCIHIAEVKRIFVVIGVW